MHRTRIASLIGATVAGVLLLSSCREIAQPPLVTAAIRSLSVDTTADGGVLMHVALSEPATVQVDYWSDAGRKLRITSQIPSDEGTLFISALRPGERYHYQAVALDRSGAPGQMEEGAFNTPELPDDIDDAIIRAHGHSSLPLTMLELNGAFKGYVAIDETGTPVWWWHTQGTPQGFSRRANGNFVFIDVGYGLFEVRPDGQVVHQLAPLPSGDREAHHDVVSTRTNTLLFLSQERRTIGGREIVGDAIWEWNPETNDVARRWSVFDFYDPAVDVGERSTLKDWVHANSLAIGDHGNVILSLNWLDQVISIAPDWHSIEWKAGGRNSDFEFDADASFQGQHTAAILPNGHLLVFDNGRDRDPPDRMSRGLEVALDPSTHRAHRAWSFRPHPDIYAPYVGSTRQLSNGNHLVFFGTPSGFADVASGPIAGFEVTSDGAVVWDVYIAVAIVVYRATPLASIAGEVDVP